MLNAVAAATGWPALPADAHDIWTDTVAIASSFTRGEREQGDEFDIDTATDQLRRRIYCDGAAESEVTELRLARDAAQSLTVLHNLALPLYGRYEPMDVSELLCTLSSRWPTNWLQCSRDRFGLCSKGHLSRLASHMNQASSRINTGVIEIREEHIAETHLRYNRHPKRYSVAEIMEDVWHGEARPLASATCASYADECPPGCDHTGSCSQSAQPAAHTRCNCSFYGKDCWLSWSGLEEGPNVIMIALPSQQLAAGQKSSYCRVALSDTLELKTRAAVYDEQHHEIRVQHVELQLAAIAYSKDVRGLNSDHWFGALRHRVGGQLIDDWELYDNLNDWSHSTLHGATMDSLATVQADRPPMLLVYVKNKWHS
jgi:hypothetical protein